MSETTATTTPTAERWMQRAFVLTAVVKLLLAIVVPFTTDEAYFVLWGKNLDYGYYDHGAMTGWWLWAMLLVSDSGWWLRLPALITSHLVGWTLWRMLRPIDRTRAAWAVVLYLVSPVHLANFLITTDTPLQFFSMISVACALRGVQTGRLASFLQAGVALGFAFLSKYFAVLLGLSYAVVLLFGLGRPRIKELLVLLAGIVPGVGINIAWNYHHWWVNVLFNLVTRQESSGFTLVPPLAYVLTMVGLAGPGLLWIWWRNRERGRWRETLGEMRSRGTVVLAGALVVPLGMFFLVSFTHMIGVHWVLSFFPLLYPVLFHRFTAETLRRMIPATMVWSMVPLCLVAVGSLLLPRVASGHRSAFSIVLAADPAAVLEALEPYRSRYVLTTPSYAKSALLGLHAGTNVPVIGNGSYHGRQDDLLTDFRTLDGQNVMIVTNRRRDLAPAEAWFARSEVHELTVHGATFFAVLGEGFNYARYRELVLQEVANRYYRMPDWLRPLAAPCFFFERYDVRPQPE